MRLQYLPLGGLLSSAAAAKLYVSSYAGTVTTLQLDTLATGFSLSVGSVNRGCGQQASWLTLAAGVVYCVDEAFSTPNGSVSSFRTTATGELTPIDKHDTIGGPVSTVLYNGGKALASAHYGGSAVTSWTLLPTGGLSALQTFIFKLTAPGANPSRQEAPHPHQALIDPTDSFVVIPDLGADLIRVFSIDPATSSLTESKSFSVKAGSGPRHGSFLKTSSGSTFFFLISELTNTIASYEVTYEGMGTSKALSFREVFIAGTYGNLTTPTGAAAAEAILSPDQKFLITSSRLAPIFDIPNFDSANTTKIPSDSLQTWIIDPATGKLSFQQIAPSGGRKPRQFSTNKNGTLAAVGLQDDSRVVIINRNVTDGTFGNIVAHVNIPGEITCVIWDE